MLVDYTIRVDNINPEIAGILEEYLNLEYIERYLIFHEVSTVEKKPHYQGVISINSEKIKNEDKRRNDFRKYFWMLDKSQKSSTKVKDENYLIYITKDNDLRYNKAFTMEEINELYKKSYKKGSIQTKDKKVSNNEILVNEFKAFMNNPLTGEIDYRKLRNEVILEFLLKKYNNNFKGFNEFMLISKVNMLRNAVYDKFRREKACWEIAEKIKDKIIP